MRHPSPWLAGVPIAAWLLPAPAAHVPPLCAALGVRRRIDGAGGTVGLTFDDGPHRLGTPAILRALDDAAATATFFVVGEQIRRDPGAAREILAAGHDLAVHGDRHRNLMRVPPRALRADLDRCAGLVEDLTGRRVRHYRPPYGIFTPAALREARRRGWVPMLWSRWGCDWRASATPASILARIGADVGAGDVVLLHDADDYSAAGSWRATAAAVPQLLGLLAERGLRARPL
jgi:peptidoglycan/xylan/chitin deacetylase (PgdA/CDA1 family)